MATTLRSGIVWRLTAVPRSSCCPVTVRSVTPPLASADCANSSRLAPSTRSKSLAIAGEICTTGVFTLFIQVSSMYRGTRAEVVGQVRAATASKLVDSGWLCTSETKSTASAPRACAVTTLRSVRANSEVTTPSNGLSGFRSPGS